MTHIPSWPRLIATLVRAATSFDLCRSSTSTLSASTSVVVMSMISGKIRGFHQSMTVGMTWAPSPPWGVATPVTERRHEIETSRFVVARFFGR